MYLVTLCAVIGVLVGLIVAPRFDGKRLFGAGIGGVVGVFVGLFGGLAVANYVPTHDVVHDPATMVSMRTADGVTGTFVWGTGGIQGQTTYNFMIKQADGSISPRSVPADSYVAIVEDPSLTNVGYWRSTYRGMDRSSPLYNWATGGSTRRYELVRQEFRVPVGTVVQTFKVQ